MKLLLAVILLLTSCTLSPVLPFKPITSTHHVDVRNLELCEKAWGSAVSYLYSEGIHVTQDHRSSLSFTCFASQGTLYRTISYLLCPLPQRQGYTYGASAYANISGFDNQDAKLITHELMHLLLGSNHSLFGIMNPVEELWVFSSGL